MPKESIDIRREITRTKLDLDLLQKRDCTDEENQTYLQMLREGKPLPDGVVRYQNTVSNTELDEFYIVYEPEYTEKDLQEYLALMQYQELKTIRKCAIALVVFAAIALALGLWIVYCSNA